MVAALHWRYDSVRAGRGRKTKFKAKLTMTNIWKMRTIQEALNYCKGYVVLYHEDMSKKEKEDLASYILSFSFGDYFEGWAKEYPVVNEIENLASNLEWSNAFDVDEDWRKLKVRIDELDQQVNSKK
jgi:hypothetical protein